MPRHWAGQIGICSIREVLQATNENDLLFSCSFCPWPCGVAACAGAHRALMGAHESSHGQALALSRKRLRMEAVQSSGDSCRSRHETCIRQNGAQMSSCRRLKPCSKNHGSGNRGLRSCPGGVVPALQARITEGLRERSECPCRPLRAVQAQDKRPCTKAARAARLAMGPEGRGLQGMRKRPARRSRSSLQRTVSLLSGSFLLKLFP